MPAKIIEARTQRSAKHSHSFTTVTYFLRSDCIAQHSIFNCECRFSTSCHHLHSIRSERDYIQKTHTRLYNLILKHESTHSLALALPFFRFCLRLLVLTSLANVLHRVSQQQQQRQRRPYSHINQPNVYVDFKVSLSIFSLELYCWAFLCAIHFVMVSSHCFWFRLVLMKLALESMRSEKNKSDDETSNDRK